MIVRDHYFAAWAIERGESYTINNGMLRLNVDREQWRRLQMEYKAQHKDYFDTIKKLVRAINASRV